MAQIACRFIPLPFAIFCLVLTVSCDGGDDDKGVGEPKEFTILTHPDAINIERHRLQETGYWQANYEVNVSYPETAVGTQQRSALIEMGWVECHDWSAGWSVHLEKVSDTRFRCVYQKISRFQNANKLLSIMHYYGDQIVESYECPSIPTNPMQTVIVTIHSYDDVKAAAAKLGLTCGPQ